MVSRILEPLERSKPIELLERIAASLLEMAMVQELLGHRDVSTTMIYTHVLNRGERGVNSPADGLVQTPNGCMP